jgi:starvation-inducible outer membrane lipoprotein
VVFAQYLDEAVYETGRRLTVVGKLQGSRRQPLGSGKVDYAYPLLEGQYVYLWPRPQNITVYEPPFWNNHYYWNGSPYSDPWWGTRPYPIVVHPRGDREDGRPPRHTDKDDRRK